MVNTTGAITKEEMGFLPTTFAPSNIQRFASVHLANGNQEWISENIANYNPFFPIPVISSPADGKSNSTERETDTGYQTPQ